MSAPLTEAEAERVIRRTFSELDGMGQAKRKGATMNNELLTENGRPSKAEANIQVAIAQGRILPEDAERWRDEYVSRGYEATTKALVKTRVGGVSAGRSYSDEAWEQYARATWVTPPSSGYSRSVL